MPPEMAEIIVAYHTPGPYADEAERLRWSVDALGLRADIRRIDDANLYGRGGWRANTHARPAFLCGMIAEHAGLILSLDADCVVHSDPWPLCRGYATCDVAMHYFPHRLDKQEPLPGTLLLRNTEATERFLLSWQTQNILLPERPDRVNFRHALAGTHGLKIGHLPPELCWIFDASPSVFGKNVEPVIEHLQAGRSYRPGPGQRKQRPANEARKRRIAEMEAAP